MQVRTIYEKLYHQEITPVIARKLYREHCRLCPIIHKPMRPTLELKLLRQAIKDEKELGAIREELEILGNIR